MGISDTALSDKAKQIQSLIFDLDRAKLLHRAVRDDTTDKSATISFSSPEHEEAARFLLSSRPEFRIYAKDSTKVLIGAAIEHEIETITEQLGNLGVIL